MKDLHAPKVMLYVSYCIVVAISAFFDKAYLKIALPITLFLLIVNHIRNNPRINYYFICSIIPIIISDYLLYTSMVDHFTKICTLIAMYLIFSTLALKDYITQIKMRWCKLISLSLLISLLLIVYLVFAISELVLHLLPGSVPYILLAVTCLLAYVAISYYIYVSDMYGSGIKLLISACLFIFIIALTPINELFYPNRAFTIFITTSHIGGIYVFMKFLKETNPAEAPSTVTKYI